MAYVMPLLPVMPNFNSNLSNATAYMLPVMIFSTCSYLWCFFLT